MNKEQVWEDNTMKEWYGKIFFIFIFFIMSYIVLLEKSFSYILIFIKSMLIVVVTYFVFIQFRRKTCKILPTGIFVGNIVFKKSHHIFLNQKVSLITWSNIKDIKLISKLDTRGSFNRPENYLLLRTKEDTTLECLIYDYKGFIKTLKSLKKNTLLSKDSKYL
jgi:hypothetical protein